ncbi:DUF1501 domain-containing protein [Singulisphaera sp. Ch08]|uniref:DUF1501 domain-containing protein n=1 Tax=Singulisphaera sp. Ch08 TaxID=3120278 RepID=A0AAU7CPJ9_9BACT
MAKLVERSFDPVANPISRRTAIRLGGIGLGGLTLPELFRMEKTSQAGVSAPKGRAKSVIILFLSGGPAHQDMWDLKPDAPEEVRGTFRPIDTNVPGIAISEHLPRMAGLADKYAILRSVHHRQSGHPAAAYWMMVGSPITRPVPDASFMSRSDRPHPGSAVAKLIGGQALVPPFVMVPEAMAPNGPERAGQHAGFLGGTFDPYRINSDPNLPNFTPGVLSRPLDLTADRLEDRRALRELVGTRAFDFDRSLATLDVEGNYARAFDLLGSPATQQAFNIHAESDSVRDRYGRHVFGQSVLLARRMVEAGVRLVHVNWVRHDGGTGGAGYDTHSNHLESARTKLLPPTDAAFASLIEDLDARGRLDETLVIMMGEFGRTPRFNKAGGRDHWPYCFSVVMAGGGIRGGQVFGASDKIGAYPASDPVLPEAIVATLYHALGIDPQTLLHDQQERPFTLAEGNPIHALL